MPPVTSTDVETRVVHWADGHGAGAVDGHRLVGQAGELGVQDRGLVGDRQVARVGHGQAGQRRDVDLAARAIGNELEVIAGVGEGGESGQEGLAALLGIEIQPVGQGAEAGQGRQAQGGAGAVGFQGHAAVAAGYADAGHEDRVVVPPVTST